MFRKWDFSTPRISGAAPKEGHLFVAGLWRRQLTRDGFFGPVADFFQRNPPTAWEAVDDDLRPRLFDTSNVSEPSNSPWDAAELLVNSDVRFRYWRTRGNMDHLVRNADGDELLFVHSGAAELFCDFGHISLVPGDYFVIPRGTMWRVEAAGELEMLLIESTNTPYSVAQQPSLGGHVPVDPGTFGVPEIDEAFRSQARSVSTPVRVKRRNRVGLVVYPFNPLDTEGWRGSVFPIRLNVKDLRPVHSFRGHLVPTAAMTFISERFIVCTFTPYPSPTDTDVAKIPSFHDNVDYDEIMFMHEGSKTHRTAAFRPGTLTFHPCGINHGPHPKAFPLLQDTSGLVPLESTYIMVDTRSPLELGLGAQGCDVAGYGMSWREGIEYAPDAQAEVKSKKGSV